MSRIRPIDFGNNPALVERAGNTSEECDADPNRKYGYAIAEIMRMNPSAKVHSVLMLPNQNSDYNADLLNYIAEKSGGTTVGSGSVASRLQDIFNRKCGQRINAKYLLRNSSQTNYITGITTSICNNNRTNCQENRHNLSIAPGQLGKISDDLTLPSDNRFIASCVIGYRDGTKRNCPSRLLTGADDLRFTLRVSETASSGRIQTGSEMSDINGDGQVNALDFARCAGRTSRSNVADSACDLDLTSSVDSLDLSIIIANLGKKIE